MLNLQPQYVVRTTGLDCFKEDYTNLCISNQWLLVMMLKWHLININFFSIHQVLCKNRKHKFLSAGSQTKTQNVWDKRRRGGGGRAGGNVSCQLGERKSKKDHEDALSLIEEYGNLKKKSNIYQKHSLENLYPAFPVHFLWFSMADGKKKLLLLKSFILSCHQFNISLPHLN